jgi:hypothetical protein
MAAAQLDIRTIIDRLVEERQGLRAAAADRATLDANRNALAYWQLELTRALARDALARPAAAAA